MSEQEQLNWVEKKHRAEKHLAESKAELWHDLCSALTDASRSFNQLYAGKAETTPKNGHRFRIALQAQGRKRLVDVDFDEAACTVTAEYDASPIGSVAFSLAADHVSAFFEDKVGRRIAADQVSRDILAPVFFVAGKAQ